MKAKSSLVLALVAGAACSTMANDDLRIMTKVRPAPAARHVSLDIATGEYTMGAKRLGALVWDAYSVYTGYYTIQEGSAFATSGCGTLQFNHWVNGGDLPPTTIDGFQVGYYAPGASYVFASSQAIVSSGQVLVYDWWNQMSERRDTCDNDAIPPTSAMGIGLINFPGGATYAWILTVDLEGTTIPFCLQGSDEDCAIDSDSDKDGVLTGYELAGDAHDWGWGITWFLNPQTQGGGVGPLITDAGPSYPPFDILPGSEAPGALDRWSVYANRDGVEDGSADCGFDYFFGGDETGAIWADFWMGLYGVDGCGECPDGDCDNDGICDSDEVDCNADGIPDDCQVLQDCNEDGEADECDPLHCPADLAAPHPTLNVFDFLAFQTLFSNQDPCADLAPPFGNWNVFDFLAFQTEFSNGCPT